jgi:hypothetical protein
MITYFIWAFLAAVVYGVARGVADGGRMTGGALATVWIVAFLFYGAIFAYFSPWEGSDDGQASVNNDRQVCESPSAAYSMAKQFVEKQLVSPATAEFPSIFGDEVTTSYVGDCKHHVTAYVDSENGFGAMIRTHFLAKVQNEYGTSTWVLKDLTTR